MAITGLALTLADAVLKEDYKGPLRKQINDMNVLSAQVAKNRDDIYGRRAVIPLQVGRNTSVGARAEGDVLFAAAVQGNQATVDQYVPLRSQYGKIRLSRQVISRMEKDRGAFVRSTALEMDGLRDDCARDYNRQEWGNSDAILATCGTTTASATVVLASTTPEQTLVNLAEGMCIDIGTVVAPTVVASSRTVTGVDFTNKTVTISGAVVTTTSAHFLFRQGAATQFAGSGSSNVQRELTGIQAMVKDTGSLFNVDPATYFSWASIVESNGGVARPVSENIVTKAMMRCRNRSGQADFTLYAEDQAYRAAVNNLSAKHRIVNTLELKGGHSAVAYVLGGKEYPLVAERDAPTGVIYGLCHPKLVEYVDEDWQFEDMDGSALRLATDGTHTFEAIFFKFSEFATVQRNAHFLLSDLELA